MHYVENEIQTLVAALTRNGIVNDAAHPNILALVFVILAAPLLIPIARLIATAGLKILICFLKRLLNIVADGVIVKITAMILIGFGGGPTLKFILNLIAFLLQS
jgi:hypothetical protein